MNKFTKIKKVIDKRIGHFLYRLLKQYNPNVFKIISIRQREKEETGRFIYELVKPHTPNPCKLASDNVEERKELGRLIHESLNIYDKNLFCLNPVAACENNIIEDSVRLNEPYLVTNSKIGRGSYVASNSIISFTDIGNFCSIGPNLTCGYGIHPVNGISTSPCFFSTEMQNGMTFTAENKVIERKEIKIGNDVFIGMNVSILDGITIGDGAVIGAGAVVTKDVAPYSIVGGVPAKHLRYRFGEKQIEQLLKIQWWKWDDERLKNVEKNFFDIDKFILENSEAGGSL